MTAKKLLRSLEQSLQRACDHKQETRQLLILHYWNRFHHVGSQSIEAHSWPIFFFCKTIWSRSRRVSMTICRMPIPSVLCGANCRNWRVDWNTCRVKTDSKCFRYPIVKIIILLGIDHVSAKTIQNRLSL